MPSLTLSAALALAAACGGGLDPQMLVGIAKVESGLDPAAIHVNRNGSRDIGLMQVNTSNFQLLGLDEKSALDPCVSLAAGAHLLKIFSGYNTGSPSRGIVNNYAASVVGAVQAIRATRGEEGAAAADQTGAAAACPTDPDGWHVTALPAGCHADDDGWRTGAEQ